MFLQSLCPRRILEHPADDWIIRMVLLKVVKPYEFIQSITEKRTAQERYDMLRTVRFSVNPNFRYTITIIVSYFFSTFRYPSEG